jgi:DNA-binding CsgD family transcriptional regulator
MLLFARGAAAAACGDHEAAVRHLTACGEARLAWGERNPAADPWRSELALALHALGRPELVPSLLAAELRLARRFGARHAIGRAERAAALVRCGSEQIDGLRAAVATLACSTAAGEHARALVELGAALRRAGRRTEARAVLAEGLDRARACGAHVLAERARGELRTAGARPRRDRLRGPEALTAAERRVAELASDGLTNRQIAQALFLTIKTVETHMSHVLAKLDIRGRDELATALAPGGAG